MGEAAMKVHENLYWYREKGFLDSNTYVIRGDITILIDPGLRKYAQIKAEEMQNDGIDTKSIDIIAVTHLHPDHCDAISFFKERADAKIALHTSQIEHKHVLRDISRILHMECFDFHEDIVFDALGEVGLDVLHTPGHSPESICFFVKECSALMCGDLFFLNGVGRTDLPYGDESALISSIELVRALDADIVMPGHGDIIRNREEVRRNFEIITSFFR